MTKDDIQLLYEYDRWANGKVLDAAAILSTEDFTRNLGGGFPSIRDTLLHIIAGEWIWLQYWKAETLDMKFVADLEQQRDRLFHGEQFPTATTVRDKWREIEREQVAFVASTSEEALYRMLPERTVWVPLVQLMQHVANHSTYHRGQVALMMRQLGVPAVPTDFHVFLADRQAQK